MLVTSVNWSAITVNAEETTEETTELVQFTDLETLQKYAKANSEQWPAAWTSDGKAAWAFDGDDSHWWHSRYQDWGEIGDHEVREADGGGNVSADNPIWIQTGFGKAWDVKEVHYASRPNSNRIGACTIGIANLKNPLATPTDEDFTTVWSDTLQDTNDEQVIDLGEFYTATHVRLTATSRVGSGDDHITAKLISFYGKDVVIDTEEEVGIIVTQNPDKTVYITGDTLDLTGLVVEKVYNTGRTEVIEDYEGIGFDYDSELAGNQEVTVTYNGFTATFSVEFIAKGSARDDSSDVTMTVTSGSYQPNNNTEGDPNYVLDNDSGTIWHTLWSGSEREDQWLVFTFENVTTIDGMRFMQRGRNGTPNGLVYSYNLFYRADESSDWIYIKKNAAMDSSEDVSAVWQLIEFAPVAAKQIKFQVVDAYSDSSTKYGAAAEVRLTAAAEDATAVTLTGIEITAPTKTTYTVGETLDLTGLAVNAVYSDNSTIALDENDYTVSDVNLAEAGTKTVTVTYAGKTATFEVTVNEVVEEDADYTAVNAAKASAAAVDRDLYTADSLAVLDAAVAAVEEGKKISEQATVDGYAAAINEAIAALEEKEALTLTVSGDNCTISVTLPEGKAANQLELDDKVTIVAAPAEGYEFSYWRDSDTGKVMSENVTYTFTMLADTNLEAVCKEVVSNMKEVVFKTSINFANYEIARAEVEVGTEVTIPEAKAFTCYEFAGWDNNEDGAVDVAADIETYTVTEDMTFVAVYTAIEAYTVTVENGTISGAEPLENGKYQRDTILQVVANEASEGKYFAGWYDGDTLISTNASYKFYVKKDMALEARYAEEKIVVTEPTVAFDAKRVDLADGKDKITLQVSWDAVNSGCKIVGEGILRTFNASAATEDDFVLGTTGKGITTKAAGVVGQRGVYTYNVSIGENSQYQDQSIYVRGYVRYTDSEGNLKTIYTDIVELEKLTSN